MNSYLHNSYGQAGYGGHAGAFLRLGMGVRPLSMGGAFTAVANDVTATYWNPSGLAQIENIELFGMYSIMSLNRKYNCIAFSFPAGRIGAIGFNYINLGIDNIIGRDQYGQVTNELSNSESAIYLSYGGSIKDIFYFGGTWKFLNNSLAGFSASGSGYDLGFLIRLGSLIWVGTTFQDINSNIEWNTSSRTQEKFPGNNRIGIAIRRPDIPFLVAFDYEKNVREENGIIHVGMEFRFSNRFGINCGFCDNSLTGGGFLSLPLSTKCDLEIQYALYDEKINEPVAHRVSLLLRFSGKAEKSVKMDRKIPEAAFDEEELFNQKLEGSVIKVVNDIYGLIDIGLTKGISEEMIMDLYHIEDNKSRIKIGKVQVIKARDNDAAVKLISISGGYSLKIGDKVTL